jgi:hypothetical protein
MFTYLLISIGVGLLLVCEGNLLHLYKGISTPLIKTARLIQLKWLLISFIVCFQYPFLGWQTAVPAVFVVYYALWTFSMVFKLDPEHMEELKQIRLPVSAINNKIIFGLMFTVFSLVGALSVYNSQVPWSGGGF